MIRRSRTEQGCNRDREQTVSDIDFSEKISRTIEEGSFNILRDY
jgi:hypothetical protein